MTNNLVKNGAKLVATSFVPWWMRIIYKILKKKFYKPDMATVEPDGLGDGPRSVSRPNEHCNMWAQKSNYRTRNSSCAQLKSMDANRYATKKTIAQGMLDIALLTANASQLKYILQVGQRHEFYTLMLTLICISIVMQVSSCKVFIGNEGF